MHVCPDCGLPHEIPNPRPAIEHIPSTVAKQVRSGCYFIGNFVNVQTDVVEREVWVDYKLRGFLIRDDQDWYTSGREIPTRPRHCAFRPGPPLQSPYEKVRQALVDGYDRIPSFTSANPKRGSRCNCGRSGFRR